MHLLRTRGSGVVFKERASLQRIKVLTTTYRLKRIHFRIAEPLNVSWACLSYGTAATESSL
jgi:hypothetical protein